MTRWGFTAGMGISRNFQSSLDPTQDSEDKIVGLSNFASHLRVSLERKLVYKYVNK